MTRVDSHIHFWDPARLHYDWLAHVPALSRPFLPSDAMPLAEASIFVQADCRPDEAIAEVDWVASFAEAAGIGAIVAFAPLELGDAVAGHLEMLKQRPLVRGVRRLLQDEPPGFISSDLHIAGLVAAARAGLACDLCVRVHQLAELAHALEDVFKREPSARMVLDHLGKPGITPQADIAAGGWAGNIERLARFPNLYVKLSGLMTEADPADCPDEGFMPYLHHAIRHFGADRCMYGSDWPVLTLAGSTIRWQKIVEAASSSLPAKDQTAIWSKTAEAAYRLR